jgi:hypothetical protein
MKARTTGRASHPLALALEAEQDRLGMSDYKFAARIGVTRSNWNLTRLGIKKPGVTIARAAMQFPSLRALAFSILVGEDTNNSVSDTVREVA